MVTPVSDPGLGLMLPTITNTCVWTGRRFGAVRVTARRGFFQLCLHGFVSFTAL